MKTNNWSDNQGNPNQDNSYKFPYMLSKVRYLRERFLDGKNKSNQEHEGNIEHENYQEYSVNNNVKKKSKFKLSECEGVTIVLVPDRKTYDAKIVDAASRFAIANLAILCQKADTNLANRTTWFVQNPINPDANPVSFTCEASNIYNQNEEKTAFTSNPDSPFYISKQKLAEVQKQISPFFGVYGDQNGDIASAKPNIIVESVEYGYFNRSFNQEIYEEGEYIANKICKSVIGKGTKVAFLSIDESYQKDRKIPISTAIRESLESQGVKCNVVVINIDDKNKSLKNQRQNADYTSSKMVRFNIEDEVKNISITKSDLEKDSGVKCYKKMTQVVKNKVEIERKAKNKERKFDGHEREEIMPIGYNEELRNSISASAKRARTERAVSLVVQAKMEHIKDIEAQHKLEQQKIERESVRQIHQNNNNQPLQSQTDLKHKSESFPRCSLWNEELTQEEKNVELLQQFRQKNLHSLRRRNDKTAEPHTSENMNIRNSYRLSIEQCSVIGKPRTEQISNVKIDSNAEQMNNNGKNVAKQSSANIEKPENKPKQKRDEILEERAVRDFRSKIEKDSYSIKSELKKDMPEESKVRKPKLKKEILEEGRVRNLANKEMSVFEL